MLYSYAYSFISAKNVQAKSSLVKAIQSYILTVSSILYNVSICYSNSMFCVLYTECLYYRFLYRVSKSDNLSVKIIPH